MGLDELIRELESVREKISKFRQDLEGSEALTRYALVDPVLCALGWDVFDPEKVRPEFPTEQGRPDYALLWEGKPLIMVEVKPLHANLEKAQDKGFNYCWKNKVRYFVITDGERWEIYDMKEMGGELITTANLSGNLGHAARQLLVLWRPAMPELRPAPLSLFETVQKPAEQPDVSAAQEDVSAAQEELIGLADLLKLFKSGEIKPGAKPPRQICFPDNQKKSIQYWREILLVTVAWAEKRLKEKLPLGTLVAETPEGMRAPRKVGSVYVETHFSAKDCVRSATRVLREIGVNPNEVKVELSAQL
jgi:hypothetical protein